MSSFLDLYESLPRQGPGNRAALELALAVVGLGRDQRILDAGCGTGADIERLRHWAPSGHVTAVDRHAPFIEQVAKRYGDDPGVTAVIGSMADQSGPFDLIWSAGALYFLGLENGLKTLREKLTPTGHLLFTHPAYFTGTPSKAARSFWEGEGEVLPMKDVCAHVRAAGFEILDAAKLDDSAWEAYYAPLQARIHDLRGTAGTEMRQTLDMAQAEIDGWRAARGETGYIQIVAQRI